MCSLLERGSTQGSRTSKDTAVVRFKHQKLGCSDGSVAKPPQEILRGSPVQKILRGNCLTCCYTCSLVVRSELRRIECAADNILWKVDIALVKPARDDLGRNNSINKNITNNNNISVGTRPLYQCFVLPVSQLKQHLTKTTNHTN
ncbi:unnamed protein product [Polarella glacialis]|uniref:Uncharacterized protein n=1 Tax=Polarella glacialis TaxID=89957 RepID=A0A813G4A8_POLGL|nr:unnamed protein product [Polarella glacialis]